ncbi:MAG TPA: chemotaxis-specific protein-glutamate methyltransferase CheB [Verrucomicrobiae bacterium]|nr:chemotaxis-specific protein-glutamate methyltransferase CheB [Verrucomicrobiae bacterium]
MSAKRVRVLVVEDSPVVRQLLVHLLETDPELEVVGTARDGREAVDAVQRLRPDVVTMDVLMPGMDGLDATRRILETNPVPIVIVSGTVNPKEVSTTFEVLKTGAVAAIQRPAGPGSADHQRSAQELLRTVKLMSEVRVVRRWPRREHPHEASPLRRELREQPLAVGIGASTGGPDALENILRRLPRSFPVPVLVVQHIAAGFHAGLAEWLGRTSSLPVALARDGEKAEGGRVYIAPHDTHMGLSREQRIVLTRGPVEKGVRPAVGYLFRSLLASCGARSVAVLLTGMGEDGAAELRDLRSAGAATIVQDRESCVVYGMPGAAVREGGAAFEAPPQRIARIICNQVHCEGGEE